MGDEVRRTQRGNNNAYCQDNESSWFDWSLLDEHADILRFVKCLIRFRLNLPVYQKDLDLGLADLLRKAHIQWHGVKLGQPDWAPWSRSLALMVHGAEQWFHVMLNAYWEALAFEIPPLPKSGATQWRRVVDTYADPPEDFCEPSEAPVVSEATYVVQPRSVVLLLG
jgi:glycogen operon protein